MTDVLRHADDLELDARRIRGPEMPHAAVAGGSSESRRTRRSAFVSRCLPTFAIVDRDLRKYFRSPALMTVSLFLPLLQLVVIGYAFGGQIRDVSVALVTLDRGEAARRLREKFQAI